MALTIQQLYDKYTGREADLTGLQFWTEAFLGGGDTVIDANDEASFARAVAAARAQGTEPAAVKPVATPTTPVTTTATTATATPAATTTTATPAATTTTTTPAATTATTATTSAPINLNNGTFLTAAGKIVDASGNVLADTGYAATATLTQQILGQNLTDRWQGQGWGTAQANASDMARMMATAGITDIKQFGVIPDLEPVVPIDTLYNGKRVFTQTDEDGKTSSYVWEPTGKMLTYNSTDTGEVTYPESRLVTVPKDAKLETVYGVARDGGEYGASYVPVDQSKIKTVDGKLVGDTGKTTFGNKLTGQAIANNYETGSNAFGGTTAGKGNTGYRVQFAPDGTPLFYTSGASSSDIGQLMPLIQLGLVASGAGGLLGSSLLGAGASEIATGALGNAILGGATAGISGDNILQGALLGGAGGALSGYLQGGTSALGDGFTSAGPPSGVGTFLGEGVLSGIPAWDTAAAVAATGLTMAQLAQLDLALGGAGGTVGAETLASALTTGATVPTLTNLTGGSGVLGDGFTLAGPPSGTGTFLGEGVPSGVPAWDAAYIAAGGVFDPAFALGPDGLVGTPLTPTTTTPPTTTTTPPTTDVLSTLTPGQIASIIGGIGGLLGGTAITSGGGTGGTGGVGAIPTQRVPLNTADYYNAIQQNYNRLLPAVPRDVATPLAQWYNSQYGA